MFIIHETILKHIAPSRQIYIILTSQLGGKEQGISFLLTNYDVPGGWGRAFHPKNAFTSNPQPIGPICLVSPTFSLTSREVKKCLNKRCPQFLMDYFYFNRDIVQRKTQQSNHPSIKLECTKKAFYYHGCEVFNRNL